MKEYFKLLAAVLLLLLCIAIWLSGCAVRKPAIKPGHDPAHPALTPVGKVTCHTGLLKAFGSYGWKNCKNEEPVHAGENGAARTLGPGVGTGRPKVARRMIGTGELGRGK